MYQSPDFHSGLAKVSHDLPWSRTTLAARSTYAAMSSRELCRGVMPLAQASVNRASNAEKRMSAWNTSTLHFEANPLRRGKPFTLEKPEQIEVVPLHFRPHD